MRGNTWLLPLSVSVALLSAIPASFCDQLMMQGIVPSRNSPAVDDISAQIKLNPNSENYKSRAEALRRLGLRKEAVDDLNKAIELEPANVQNHMLRGRVYFEDGMYPEAIRNLDAAINVDPKFVPAYALRANSFLKLKEYSKAFDDANALLKLDPSSPLGLYLRGAANNGLKNYDDAIKDCTAAINANPKMEKAYFWRAEAYQNAGQYQKSVDDFGQAISLQPDYRPALLGRAWSNYKLGKDEDALKDCLEAIKFHDADDLIALNKYIGEKATEADIVPEPEYLLGAQIEEDLKNALVLFDDVIKDKPGDPEALRDRGMAYMHLGKYSSAIKDFEAANKGLPTNPSDYSGLGSEDAYKQAKVEYLAGNDALSKGDNPNAIAHYQAALKLYPTYGRCWHNLAIASSNLGDNFTAELCCIHGISYRPDDWKLWNTLGYAQYHEYKRDKTDPNKLSAAASALHQALALKPDTDDDKKRVQTLLAAVKSYERSLAPISDFIFTTMPIN